MEVVHMGVLRCNPRKIRREKKKKAKQELRDMIKQSVIKAVQDRFIPLEDGDKVWIDDKEIKKHPVYTSGSEELKKFVDDNVGTMLTVKTIEQYRPLNKVVTLEENELLYFPEEILLRVDKERYVPFEHEEESDGEA